MTDNNSSEYTHSITASLNEVDQDLTQHLHETQYWAQLNTPSIQVGQSMFDSQQTELAAKYLNYRNQSTFTKGQDPAEYLLNQIKLTPSVNGSITGNGTQQNTQQYNQKQINQNMPPRPNDEPNIADTWKVLMQRAQTALNAKTPLKMSEKAIQLMFERLLNKVELHNIQKNHTVPQSKKTTAPKQQQPGAFIKSLPQEDEGEVQEEQDENELNEQQRKVKKVTSELSKKYKTSTMYQPFSNNAELTLEEQQLKAQLDTLPKSHLISLLMQCAKLLPQLPTNPQEIPLLLKSMIKNSPALIQMQNLLLFAHEKLNTLYNSLQNAPELQQYSAYCQKLLSDFMFITEKQVSYLDATLADYRELLRFRLRVSDLSGHQYQSPINKNGLVSVYDSIKQNGIILEKLQLLIDQHAGQNRPSATYLAADELIERCREYGVGVNPTGNSGLGAITDTVLYSQGGDRERYLRQCVSQAVQEMPKILIRLTDAEAYQAFQVLIFIVNYFSKLFQTASVNQMIGKLAEVHMYVSTAKTLISNIRKNLGLHQNASAGKIIEAVQVLSTRAVEEAGGTEILDTVKQMLRCEDVDDIVGKLRAVLIQARPEGGEEAPENEEDQNEDD